MSIVFRIVFLVIIIFSCSKKNIINNDPVNTPGTFLLDTAFYYSSTGASSLNGMLWYDYTFDTEGRVIAKSEHAAVDTYSTNYTYTYGENSLLKEANVHKLNSKKIYTYKFTYTNNVLTNIVITHNLWSNYVKYTYTYENGDIKLLTIQEFKPDTIPGDLGPFGFSFTYYNLPGGRRLEIDSKGYSRIYTYNKGKKVKCVIFYGDTLGKVSRTTEYIYNNDDCLIEERNKSSSEWLTRYTYKNYGDVKEAPFFYMVGF